MAPLLAAFGQHSAPIGGFHSLAETRFALALDVGFIAKVVFHALLS